MNQSHVPLCRNTDLAATFDSGINLSTLKSKVVKLEHTSSAKIRVIKLSG